MSASRSEADVTADIHRTFADARVEGFLHAVDIDSGAEIGIKPDELVVTASVCKVPVLVELCTQAAGGVRALSDRVSIPMPNAELASRRTIGPSGLSLMQDGAELSLRDIALLMISVSDNHATDVLIDILGLSRINEGMGLLGLHQTRLECTLADLFDQMRADLGAATLDEAGALLQSDTALDLPSRLRALDPQRTNRSTPREITRLLTRVWTANGVDEAASVEIRRILGSQVIGNWIAKEFAQRGVLVSAKAGALAHIRNEVAVIEFPENERYALGVFLRLTDEGPGEPSSRAEFAISAAARLAVDHLRSLR